MHTPSFGEDWGDLSIPIHLGRYPHMRLEETVEERHILKAQRDSYLLDGQRGNLQLSLSVGQYGIVDNIPCSTLAHALDSGA